MRAVVFLVAAALLALSCGRANPATAIGSPPITVTPVPSRTVWGWGASPHNQLETNPGSPVPILLTGLSNVTAVASGSTFNLALESDGTVFEWGYDMPVPLPVSGLSGIVAISAGFDHSLGLKADGTVWAWGSNSYGQLGDGRNDQVPGPKGAPGPVQVNGLTMVTAVAAAMAHSLAIKSDGTVWAWGFNNFGQLGNGTTTNSNIPVQVKGLSGITGITGGIYFSLALQSDGTVWAWGYNRDGELATGNNFESHVPVHVSGLANVTAISSGSGFGLALKSDGTAFAWGNDDYGQLGNGTTTTSNVPVEVSGLTGVRLIAASSNSFHALAVKTDGSLWSWGYNYYGQLGDGTKTNRSIPTLVVGMSSVSAMSAGGYGSLAVQ